jgi:hypothetical protein
MPKAVRFDKYGGIGVLRDVEVERPVPGSGTGTGPSQGRRDQCLLVGADSVPFHC